MDFGLRGKYALVTGGSRGIGRATALALAGEGCHVAICARGTEWLDRTTRELRERGVDVIALQADVREPADIRRVVEAVVSKWGMVDILVNNAGGIDLPPPGLVEQAPDSVWTGTLAINLLAAARFTSLVIPHMRKQKWGRVVTLSSKQGREGGGKPWYTASKSAEIAMMKSMANTFDLARDGITFNTVAPGAVLTEVGNWADFLKESPDRLQKRVDETLPLGRLGRPEEVAAVVVFLCSASASLVSGACVSVDGGESKTF